MATTRPFAYNTGSTINGTTQIGNIAIGVTDQDYSQNTGGVKWWMGPDEELGYVVANEVPTGDHPTPVEVDSYLNFWRSTELTDQSFLDLINVLPITNGLPPFTSANAAKTWLNNNNHFTSYGELPPPTTPTPTPTASVTPTPTPTPTPTAAVCNPNYTLSNCGTSHVYNIEPGTPWDTYGNDGTSYFLQVGPSQDGGGTITPQAGWYFVDECGAIKQLLNTPIWVAPSTPSPYPNGSGWLCVVGSQFTISSSTPTLTFCETLPTVTFVDPTPTPTNTTTPTSTPTPTPSVTTTATITPTPTPSVTSTSTPTPTPSVTPTNTNTPTPTPSVTATNTPTPTPTATATSASAPMVVTMSEVGSNVVMSASGTVNLSGLTLVNPSFGPIGGGGIGINSATFICGNNGSYASTYSGFTSTPSNFGSGAGSAPSSASGDYFGVIYQGAPPYLLTVPTGYTSGANITSTQTFNNVSFSSLGLTPGTYTYTWSGGSIDVVIGGPAPTPTPTPSTGANAGQGTWYFYSDEGPMNAGAPSGNGNALFWNQTSNTETYNPNYTGGTFQIYLAPNDSTGTSYATQFSGLTTGGTITLSQNGDTAKYTLTSGQAVLGGPPGNQFFVMNINSSGIQTKTSNAPFVYADPISITFGS